VFKKTETAKPNREPGEPNRFSGLPNRFENPVNRTEKSIAYPVRFRFKVLKPMVNRTEPIIFFLKNYFIGAIFV